jgi:hypothetical protein
MRENLDGEVKNRTGGVGGRRTRSHFSRFFVRLPGCASVSVVERNFKLRAVYLSECDLLEVIDMWYSAYALTDKFVRQNRSVFKLQNRGLKKKKTSGTNPVRNNP